MKIDLIALGTKMPSWVEQSSQEYIKRFAPPWQFNLIEIPIPKRHKNRSINTLIQQEGQALLQASSKTSMRIALDEHGPSMNSKALAKMLEKLRQQHSHIALLVGGPDGHSDECRNTCEQTWSLSPLTLPHGLVRIIVAEQLYRAVALIQGHPYHRD